jgi:dienelactone hydrolase
MPETNRQTEIGKVPRWAKQCLVGVTPDLVRFLSGHARRKPLWQPANACWGAVDRPKDAYAALQYLQAQPFVKADRVDLIGWSQGGGVVLLSINDKSIGRPEGLAHEFRTAVSFYPGACSEAAQSKPYTAVEPGSWASR